MCGMYLYIYITIYLWQSLAKALLILTTSISTDSPDMVARLLGLGSCSGSVELMVELLLGNAFNFNP